MDGMDKTAWEAQYRNNRQLIEDILQDFLPQNVSFQKKIAEAMEYSLMAGGKRIRPMLLLESYRLFGGKDSGTVRAFAAAVEMIHTYSLVHDDLPAMDNDEYRRGRKTTHIVFGEDMGILAGDALLNYAYETVCRALEESEDETALRRAAGAAAILARKAGIYGMVGGQVVDVEKTGQRLLPEELHFIYDLKTGALLEASLMIGAVLAGAGEQETALMEQVGKSVGFAFQIQDDILDRTSTTQELGKPVHSDERNEKTTYVSIYGMEKALEAVECYSEKAIGLLETLSVSNPFLNGLIEALIHRKK